MAVQMHRDAMILRPIFCAIHLPHHLMLQHDNAQLHDAMICTQFLEVLAWPSYSSNMSSIEHVWDALDLRVFVFLLFSLV